MPLVVYYVTHVTGVRLVVEVRRGADPEAVLAALYQHTRLQQRFSANMVGDGSHAVRCAVCTYLAPSGPFSPCI